MTREELSFRELIGDDIFPTIKALCLPSSRAEFAGAVDFLVDRAVAYMAQHGNLYQRVEDSDGEDRNHERRLVHAVAAQLNAALLPIEVTEDPDKRGHTDLQVKSTRKSAGYIWYAEAKIHKSSYDYLQGGMEQLLTRYTSAEDTHCGFLVFILLKDSVGTMSRWREKIADEKALDFIELAEDPACHVHAEDRPRHRKLRFVSVHEPSPSLQVRVRHIGVPLHYAPVV